MAKRADMMRQIAERRKAKVPILTLRKIKGMALTIEPVKDVRNKKADGKPGKVLKVVSTLRISARIDGAPGLIHSETEIECPERWTAVDELEQGLRPAILGAIGAIAKQYAEIQAKKRREQEQDGDTEGGDA